MLIKITVLTLSVWLVLILFGKGGFAHMLLLIGLGTGLVEFLCFYRPRLQEKSYVNDRLKN